MSKKSIKKNYVYNVLYQILSIMIPLITTPYLSRTLGAEKIGIYGYTVSIATYFILFGSLGVGIYGQREIAYVQNDIKQRSKIFYEVFIMKCFTMLLSIFTFCVIFCINGEYSFFYRILTLELIANIFDISWFFQGIEEFKKTVTKNVIIKILSILLIFIFVKNSDDLYKYFIIYVLSNLIGNLSLWLYIKKAVQSVNFKELKIFHHIKSSFLLFVPQIAVQVYTLLDKTMLGVLSNDMSSVGNYEQSQKIIKTSLVLVTALGTVVAPRIANVIASGKKEEVHSYLKKSYHFVWLLGLPLTLGIIGIAKTLVPWFLGNEFSQSIILIMIGAFLIIAIGLNNVSGVQYLIPSKKQNLFTKSVVIAALFNFAFNWFFIPLYGAVGAIIASVMAEILIIFIQAYDIKKEVNIRIILTDSYKYIIGSILMFIPVYLMSCFMKPVAATTILQIIVGGVTYVLYLFIIKDSFVFDIIIKIKKRFF